MGLPWSLLPGVKPRLRSRNSPPNDPDYTAAYFMSAQTLATAGRTADAMERLKGGISCAARSGNRHAMSEMQAMLDELDR